MNAWLSLIGSIMILALVIPLGILATVLARSSVFLARIVMWLTEHDQ